MVAENIYHSEVESEDKKNLVLICGTCIHHVRLREGDTSWGNTAELNSLRMIELKSMPMGRPTAGWSVTGYWLSDMSFKSVLQ